MNNYYEAQPDYERRWRERAQAARAAEDKITAAIGAINDHIGNPETDVDFPKLLLRILSGREVAS